jgi:hypothetical protein
MQLFMRHEENAALTPTIYYFGCSKKACLLYDDFLQSLPNPIATRGRHGICYPAWGVPPSRSVGAEAALKELEKMLVSRIKTDLYAGPRDAFAGCPSLWVAFLLLGSNACRAVGRRTRSPELGGGDFDVEEERSASPFSDPTESMCW